MFQQFKDVIHRKQNQRDVLCKESKLTHFTLKHCFHYSVNIKNFQYQLQLKYKKKTEQNIPYTIYKAVVITS